VRRFIALMAITIGYSQNTLHWDVFAIHRYVYSSLSVERQTKYSTQENSVTQVQNKGIDFDVEVGARFGTRCCFIYYVDLKR
jgi:hypothetical protein